MGRLERIKAYTPAGHDCPKSGGLTKEDRLQNKMQKRQIEGLWAGVYNCLHTGLIPNSRIYR